MPNLEHILKLMVEFEDLDAGGVVCHPNYLKLCERARSRWFETNNINFIALKNKDIALAVRSIKAEYLRPITLEEILIKMRITAFSEKSFTIMHEIAPIEAELKKVHFSAEITFVAANYSTGRACALPTEVVTFLRGENAK